MGIWKSSCIWWEEWLDFRKSSLVRHRLFWTALCWGCASSLQIVDQTNYLVLNDDHVFFYLKWLLYTNIALVFEKCSGTSLPSAGVWNQPKIQISCSVCHKAPAKASTVDFRVLYSMWAGSNVLSFILYCERNSDAVQCYGLKSRFKMLPYWPFYYFLAVISLSFYIEAILSNCCCIPKYVFYKCWQ